MLFHTLCDTSSDLWVYKGGGLYTSIDYGLSYTQRATYGANGISLGSIAMSSDGTKVIAAVYGVGESSQ